MVQVYGCANIDLKAFDDDVYAMLTNGTLQPVLNTLLKLKEKGIWLEITNLIIPQWTDDLAMIDKMCRWLASNGFKDTPLHFSRFHPQYKLNRLTQTPLPLLEKQGNCTKPWPVQCLYWQCPGVQSIGYHLSEMQENSRGRSGFTVSKNMVKDGCCSHCGSVIAVSGHKKALAAETTRAMI